MKSQEVES